MGLGAVPGRQAAFQEGLEQAVLYAKALGCPRYRILSSPFVTQDRAALGSWSGRRGRHVLRGPGVCTHWLFSTLAVRVLYKLPLVFFCPILSVLSFSVGNSFMLLSCWAPMLGAQSDQGDGKVNKRWRDPFEDGSVHRAYGRSMGTSLGSEKAPYRY